MNYHALPMLAMAFVLAACGGEPADDATTEPQAGANGGSPEESLSALPRSPSAAGARVFFITPGDGDTVTSPVRVEFGIEGMSVAPAGDAAPHSGHHHLLIDTGLPELGLPIPKDANHVHFGDGSTGTEIVLENGEHTLQLLLGDHLHIPHEPPLVSQPIRIYVESGVE